MSSGATTGGLQIDGFCLVVYLAWEGLATNIYGATLSNFMINKIKLSKLSVACLKQP